MSFCCGASMIGTRGTLKHYRTKIFNVPLLYCLVCHKVEVHYLIESEYEILAEYAHGDGAQEVDFLEYVDEKHLTHLYDNCVNHEHEDPEDVVKNQIDLALDLLMFAKGIQDEEWEQALKKRLHALSDRKRKLMQRKALDL